MDKKIGLVTHYFDKIGVAVIKLSGRLKVGDKIRIETPDGDFTQNVDSMQIDKESIQNAKKGQEVGIKVEESVKENNFVYLTE